MVIVRWRWCIEVVAIYYANDIFGDKSMRNVFFSDGVSTALSMFTVQSNQISNETIGHLVNLHDHHPNHHLISSPRVTSIARVSLV